MSGFAAVLDYITIMGYDIWGSWSSVVGPNAPLDDTCALPEYQQGSAVSAVGAWTAAGIPANQLVLGVASYGHSYLVDKTSAYADSANSILASYPSFDKSQQPMGDSWDENSPAGIDDCGNQSPGGPSGVFNFRGLIDQGLLTSNGTAVPDVPYRFDDCSQTVRRVCGLYTGSADDVLQPFIYNPNTQTMISYDDPSSFSRSLRLRAVFRRLISILQLRRATLS